MKTPNIALIVILACIAGIFVFFFVRGVDATLSGILGFIIHYFTGTTPDSGKKTDALVDIAKNGTNTVNTPAP